MIDGTTLLRIHPCAPSDTLLDDYGQAFHMASGKLGTLQPRSLWWIRPLRWTGRRSWIACSRASSTKLASTSSCRALTWAENTAYTAEGKAFVQFLLSPLHSRHMRARRTVSEVRYPQHVRCRGVELPVDLIERTRRCLVADRRVHRLAPDYILQAEVTYQPFDRATGQYRSPHAASAATLSARRRP